MSNGVQGANGWARPDGGEPDWAALAEQNEHEFRRRKKLRAIGAISGAAALVAIITVAAVALSGPGKDAQNNQVSLGGSSSEPVPTDSDAPIESPGPAASSADPATPSPSGAASSAASTSAKPSAVPSRRPSASASSSAPASALAAAPTSSAPSDPLTVISSSSTDTAPLDPATLFPATTMSVDGKTWTRLATATNSPCWQATTGGLGDVITPQGCKSLLRATYTSGDSAVTIGVAVFDARANADAAHHAHKGQVQGLVPAGHTAYCTSAGCVNTHEVVGRYTYYTVSGTVKGGTTADAVATAAGPDFAAHARTRLLARGTR